MLEGLGEFEQEIKLAISNSHSLSTQDLGEIREAISISRSDALHGLDSKVHRLSNDLRVNNSLIERVYNRLNDTNIRSETFLSVQTHNEELLERLRTLKNETESLEEASQQAASNLRIKESSLNDANLQLAISVGKALDLERDLANAKEQQTSAEQKSVTQAAEISRLNDSVNALQVLINNNNLVDMGTQKYSDIVERWLNEVGQIHEKTRELSEKRAEISNLMERNHNLERIVTGLETDNKYWKRRVQEDSETIHRTNAELNKCLQKHRYERGGSAAGGHTGMSPRGHMGPPPPPVSRSGSDGARRQSGSAPNPMRGHTDISSGARMDTHRQTMTPSEADMYSDRSEWDESAAPLMGDYTGMPSGGQMHPPQQPMLRPGADMYSGSSERYESAAPFMEDDTGMPPRGQMGPSRQPVSRFNQFHTRFERDESVPNLGDDPVDMPLRMPMGPQQQQPVFRSNQSNEFREAGGDRTRFERDESVVNPMGDPADVPLRRPMDPPQQPISRSRIARQESGAPSTPTDPQASVTGSPSPGTLDYHQSADTGGHRLRTRKSSEVFLPGDSPVHRRARHSKEDNRHSATASAHRGQDNFGGKRINVGKSVVSGGAIPAGHVLSGVDELTNDSKAAIIVTTAQQRNNNVDKNKRSDRPYCINQIQLHRSSKTINWREGYDYACNFCTSTKRQCWLHSTDSEIILKPPQRGQVESTLTYASDEASDDDDGGQPSRAQNTVRTHQDRSAGTVSESQSGYAYDAHRNKHTTGRSKHLSGVNEEDEVAMSGEERQSVTPIDKMLDDIGAMQMQSASSMGKRTGGIPSQASQTTTSKSPKSLLSHFRRDRSPTEHRRGGFMDRVKSVSKMSLLTKSKHGDKQTTAGGDDSDLGHAGPLTPQPPHLGE